jgi:hypothetical protein
MKRLEKAISYKINNSVVKKANLLELYQQRRIKEKNWLLNDTVISFQYSEGINIQNQILKHIKNRENLLQETGLSKTR